MNVPRGPCTMPVLREAWIHGVVDEHTLVWGKGLMDWLPARNVRALVPQIRTVEVQLATWVKRNLVLGPALRAVRKQRKNERPEEPTEQLGEDEVFFCFLSGSRDKRNPRKTHFYFLSLSLSKTLKQKHHSPLEGDHRRRQERRREDDGALGSRGDGVERRRRRRCCCCQRRRECRRGRGVKRLGVRGREEKRERERAVSI